MLRISKEEIDELFDQFADEYWESPAAAYNPELEKAILNSIPILELDGYSDDEKTKAREFLKKLCKRIRNFPWVHYDVYAWYELYSLRAELKKSDDTNDSLKNLIDCEDWINGKPYEDINADFTKLTFNQLFIIYNWRDRHPELDSYLPSSVRMLTEFNHLQKIVASQKNIKSRKIDFSKPLKFKDKILLDGFLKENSHRSFFRPGYYLYNGVIIHLTHYLVEREKHLTDVDGSPYTQRKFDILKPEPMAKGGYGFVFQSIKTIMLGSGSSGIVREEIDEKHVVKLTADTGVGQKNYGFEDGKEIRPTSKDRIESEAEYQKIDKRFHPKEIQFQLEDDKTTVNLLTSRLFPGLPLYKLLKERKLTVEQKYLLSISLLRALHEQIARFGLVHRDIKPGNIIVDIETMEVNIIDHGMVMNLANQDGKGRGTRVYQSPESIPFSTGDAVHYHDTSDIFSMGIVLAEIWENNEPDFQYYQIQDYYSLRRRWQSASNVSVETERISPIIASMTKIETEGRGTLDESFSALVNAYLKFKYAESNDNSPLLNSFNAGRDFRNSVISSNYNFGQYTNNVQKRVRKFIENTMDGLEDDEKNISQFVHGLGYQVLKEAKSKNEVIEKYNNVFAKFIIERDKYMDFMARIDDALKISDLDEHKKNELKTLRMGIASKFKRIEEKPFDLDALDKINKNLSIKYYSCYLRYIASLSKNTDEFKTLIDNFINSIPDENIQILAKVIHPEWQNLNKDDLMAKIETAITNHKVTIEKYEELLPMAGDNLEAREKINNKIHKYKQMECYFDFYAMEENRDVPDSLEAYLDKQSKKPIEISEVDSGEKLWRDIFRELSIIKVDNNRHSGLKKLNDFAVKLKNDSAPFYYEFLKKNIIDECEYRCNIFISNFSRLNLFGRKNIGRDEGVDLLYRSIANHAELEKYFKKQKPVETLEQLMIQQQKRDVIDELRKEIDRLQYDRALGSDVKEPAIFIGHSDFKIDAYHTLIEYIVKSDSSKSISDLFQKNKLRALMVKNKNGDVRSWKRLIDSVPQLEEEMSVYDALHAHRLFGFGTVTSAEKLASLQRLHKPADILSRLRREHSSSHNLKK